MGEKSQTPGAFILIEKRKNVQKELPKLIDYSCERRMYRLSGKGDKGGLYQGKKNP